MAEVARVGSIDAIRAFRAALIKFQEAANVALADAESEVSGTHTWLDSEQQTFWAGHIRKRSEWVSRCKEAVRMKKLFKDSAGRSQSAVDEEKALAKAVKQLEAAEQKLVLTKQHSRRIVKEFQNYKGSVQRFATAVQADIPRATAHLDALAGFLDQYISAEVTTPTGASTVANPFTAMARPSGDAAGEALETDHEFYVTDLSGFPSLNEPQVALVHANGDTGIVCLEDGTPFKGAGSRFTIFDRAEDATIHATARTASNPKMECAIYSHHMQLITVVRIRRDDVGVT